MMREGVGLVAPSPVSIRIAGSDMRACRDHALQRLTFRNYVNRRDAWGRGFIKNPILVGLIGETALCTFLTNHGTPVSPDILLRAQGDRGIDVLAAGLVLQVKTRRKGIAGTNLVKRGNEQGVVLALNCDAFVFAQWSDEEPHVDPKLLGWIWAIDMQRNGEFGRSLVASSRHWNIKVADSRLLPMRRLLDEIDSRKCAA